MLLSAFDGSLGEQGCRHSGLPRHLRIRPAFIWRGPAKQCEVKYVCISSDFRGAGV